jgi:predicted nuclease of predicted toxin-antitoxin system
MFFWPMRMSHGYAGEMATSISDIEVCALAQSERRIILTYDKDFGDLVIRDRVQVPGVILLRLRDLSPTEGANLVVGCLSQFHEWEGQFTVITKDAMRIRAMS